MKHKNITGHKTGQIVRIAAILITCDGAGKDIKEEVLEELLNRRYLDGLADANKNCN